MTFLKRFGRTDTSAFATLKRYSNIADVGYMDQHPETVAPHGILFVLLGDERKGKEEKEKEREGKGKGKKREERREEERKEDNTINKLTILCYYNSRIVIYKLELSFVYWSMDCWQQQRHWQRLQCLEQWHRQWQYQ